MKTAIQLKILFLFLFFKSAFTSVEYDCEKICENKTPLEDRPYAEMSENAYFVDLWKADPEGDHAEHYERIANTLSVIPAREKGGFFTGNYQGYVLTQTSNKVALFIKYNNYGAFIEELVFAFRGTDDVWDLNTNLWLATCSLAETQRFRESYAFVKDILDFYDVIKNGYSVVFTGHSLGGTIAVEMEKIYNIYKQFRAVAFSMGTCYNERWTGEIAHNSPKNKHYTKCGDIVTGSLMKGITYICSPYDSWDPFGIHGIDNFNR